ncbi:APA family basic amino acid/polyamine antiporter [Novosphingobium chloroacetimidivorans]|uniref:APA family basic amino acid/polyamine antiporter n=1 Tax=Novosphingobium chloroacetimidivorans TaxID=1428314 RepID=A0A7W7K8P2_9SPHN|nr:amino acid permease [Novosphingobium chloroacetimidivorans]MBB4857971.1 APA family basic amino acid/polyamine antiporter [Novosphingobium chloroacetimidivorans]
MRNWNRRKSIAVEALPSEHTLRRTLSWWHLIAMGVGAIIGTGIYTLVGIGAGLAGPAVVLSFAIAGAVCACAALCYAEVATAIPASGSAYTYSYAVVGELIAWIVGWSLILEYSLVVSAVAVGWSGYVVGTLSAIGLPLPVALTAGPHAGGLFNLPAVFIVFAVAGVLTMGTRESATLNAALVGVKIVALILFISVALPHFDVAQFKPFMPYGFSPHEIDGKQHGVMAAAAIIFFAFYGFDAISTAAEETKRPDRDLPIGIVGSMVICTAIYVGVAAVAIGAMPFTAYADSPEPLALILRSLGQGKVAVIIGAAAIVALPTVILAFLFGQSRIFFVMARDGLLPKSLAKVSTRTGAPVRMTLGTAAVVSVLAGLAPLDEIAALANAGTLVAFIAVAACMLIMRRRDPDGPRKFSTPLPWLIGPLAIGGCIYLFWSLPGTTKLFFGLWNLLGLALYAWVGRSAAIR